MRVACLENSSASWSSRFGDYPPHAIATVNRSYAPSVVGLEVVKVQNNVIAMGLVTFLFILGFILLFFMNRHKGQNDIKRALIERFGAAQDLGAFLQSEGGQRFLAGLSTGMSSPLGSVLGSVQKGIILLLLGFGCWMASSVFAEQLTAIGMLLACLGVGFLISAAVTHRLSKRWGLLDKPGDIRPRDLGK